MRNRRSVNRARDSALNNATLSGPYPNVLHASDGLSEMDFAIFGCSWVMGWPRKGCHSAVRDVCYPDFGEAQNTIKCLFRP